MTMDVMDGIIGIGITSIAAIRTGTATKKERIKGEMAKIKREIVTTTKEMIRTVRRIKIIITRIMMDARRTNVDKT
jgi:hypothetical protein